MFLPQDYHPILVIDPPHYANLISGSHYTPFSLWPATSNLSRPINFLSSTMKRAVNGEYLLCFMASQPHYSRFQRISHIMDPSPTLEASYLISLVSHGFFSANQIHTFEISFIREPCEKARIHFLARMAVEASALGDKTCFVFSI